MRLLRTSLVDLGYSDQLANLLVVVQHLEGMLFEKSDINCGSLFFPSCNSFDLDNCCSSSTYLEFFP